jgi:hypothetical protein
MKQYSHIGESKTEQKIMFLFLSNLITRNIFLQIINDISVKQCTILRNIFAFGFEGDQVAGAHRSLARIYSEAIRPRFQHGLPSSVWQKRE